MIAIKAIEMRDKFKTYCDKVVSGETVIVTMAELESGGFIPKKSEELRELEQI